MKSNYTVAILKDYASGPQVPLHLTYDATRPLNDGIKGIFGLDGVGFSSDLMLGEKSMGDIHVHKNEDGWNIIDVYIDVGIRGKGYGKRVMRDLNNDAAKEGTRLYVKERLNDDSIVILPAGRKLFESLVRSGDAERTEAGYRFKVNGEDS